MADRNCPGARNLITDVPGLSVGNAVDARIRTGVTVILPEPAAIAGVSVAGGAPGTRETDAIQPEALGEPIDALVLSGGSVYGLGAGDAVTAWLGARGRGFRLVTRPDAPTAPRVPAAILFDLANGGDKAWGEEPPYRALGLSAVGAAAAEFRLGSVGAGFGAVAGGVRGGLGSASWITDEGYTVGAIAAVNSFGSVLAPGGRTFWAAPFEIDGEFGGLGSAGLVARPDAWGPSKAPGPGRTNTTIACVATDAALTTAQAKRIAIMAQDGLARAVRPAHAPADGDVVFAISTGRRPLEGPAPLSLAVLGSVAADCLARAIARGVYEAESQLADGPPAWRDLPA